MTIRCESDRVLLDGIHHLAILSSDTDRVIDFYRGVWTPPSNTLRSTAQFASRS